MARSRKSRRDDDDADEAEARSKSKRGRKKSGGRGLIVLLIVGAILLVLLPLMAGGAYLVWRVVASGSPIPGLGRPRDRLVGQWETSPQQPGNWGLPFGGSLVYDFRADGGFTSSLNLGNGMANPDPGTWEVKTENGNLVQVKIRRPLTESQRKNFGDDLNSYDLDVEVLSNNQIRVTSFNTLAAVRVFDRKH